MRFVSVEHYFMKTNPLFSSLRINCHCHRTKHIYEHFGLVADACWRATVRRLYSYMEEKWIWVAEKYFRDSQLAMRQRNISESESNELILLLDWLWVGSQQQKSMCPTRVIFFFLTKMKKTNLFNWNEQAMHWKIDEQSEEKKKQKLSTIFPLESRDAECEMHICVARTFIAIVLHWQFVCIHSFAQRQHVNTKWLQEPDVQL